MKQTILQFIWVALVALGTSIYAEAQSLKSEVIGSGKPIIFIPGLACDGDVWKETVEEFSEAYECHVVTLPGFAGNKPFKNLDKGFLNQAVDLIKKYMRENRLAKPTIIGHSLGGSIALKMGSEHPELVEKLIIVDALPFFPAIRNPKISMDEAKSQAEGYRSNLLANANKPDEEKAQIERDLLKWMIQNSEKIALVTSWYMISDPQSMATAMYELNVTDLRESLTNISAPTLVLGSWIAGKDYGVTREMSMNNYKSQYVNLREVKLDVTDKGFHFIMWDDPDFFYSSIRSFME